VIIKRNLSKGMSAGELLSCPSVLDGMLAIRR